MAALLRILFTIATSFIFLISFGAFFTPKAEAACTWQLDNTGYANGWSEARTCSYVDPGYTACTQGATGCGPWYLQPYCPGGAAIGGASTYSNGYRCTINGSQTINPSTITPQPGICYVQGLITSCSPSCSGGSATACISSDGNFTVTVTGVSDASQVWFPTWSTVGGQNDIQWYAGTNLGGGTWRITKNRASHPGPGGTVTTHVYPDSNSNLGDGTGNVCYASDIPVCGAWINANLNGQQNTQITAGDPFPAIGFAKGHLGTNFSQVSVGPNTPANDYCGQTAFGAAQNSLAVSGYAFGTYYSSGNSDSSHIGCSRNFTVSAYNVDGQSVVAGTQSFSVVAPPPPSVDMWVSPTAVVSGNNTTYGWSSSGEDYCRFYINGTYAGDSNSGWPKDNPGGWPDGPITATKTYTIECSNAYGSDSDTATVTIIPPPSCTSAAPQAANTTLTSGTFYTYAYGVANATAVNFAVWGDPGGNDDLVWYVGQNIGGGTWRAAINMGNHKAGNPEFGTFNVHVYMNGPAATNQPCSTNGASNFTRSQINNASCVGITGVPASLQQGQTFTPTVTFNNNGSKQWNSDATPHGIGSANPADNSTWGTNRRPLPAVTNPGGNAAFTWTATAPTTPGSYNFAWQMVEDGLEWFGPQCTTAVTVVNAPPSLDTITISAPTIVANNTIPYTIAVNASDTSGASAINFAAAIINYQGTNATQYRGYLTWGSGSTYSTWQDAKACSGAGGGYAGIYPSGYGNTFLTLASCSISDAGNTRTVNFVVTFNSTYTTPVSANDIAGLVRDTQGANNPEGWKNFDINFGLGHRLTTIKAGSTGGTVTGNVGGLNCGATCVYDYSYGTNVTLTATPSAGHTFTGWSGSGCSGTGTCTVSMTTSRTVTATFALNAPTVTLTANTAYGGTGVNGSVSVYAGEAPTILWSATNSATSCTVYRNSAFPSVVGTYAYPGTSSLVVPAVNSTTGTADSYYVTCTNSLIGTSNTVTFLVPPPPTNPSYSCNLAGNSITFNWLLPTGYALNYVRAHYASEAFGCTGTAADVCVSSSGNSHTWSPITPNTPINWWAHTRAANGNWSSQVSGSGVACVPASYVLGVAKDGTGGGTVTSNPAGIACGAICSASYSYGTLVQLTAAPTVGSVFAGWTGGGCSGTGTCSVTMTAAQNVTATFNIASYALTVARDGTGLGAVASNPAGINCGIDCTEPYNYNTSVTLTAAPNIGHVFAGWSGSGCSGTGTCVTTVTGTQSVTATFDALPDLYPTNSGPAANSVFSSTGAINFTGSAVNTNAASIGQGGWADVEIDWNSDGSFDNYNAFNNLQLGAFTPGQTKALTYTYSNPPVGTHRYRFNVDTTNSLTESNESNRSTEVTFRVANGTITATPSTIDYNSSTTVAWNSSGTGGLTCLVTGGSDSWPGVSGSQEKLLFTNTTYTFSCNGTALASAPVTVNVNPTLTAPVTRVEEGSVVTLSYDTKGQTCELDPGNISVTGMGTRDVTVTALTIYTLDCPVGDTTFTIEITPTIFES